MVSLVKHDLEYILKQIKIAEAHAAGGDLAELVGSPLAPYGLRTVDGSYNNLVPGRAEWGAADNPFLPMTTAGEPANDADGDTMYFGPGTVLTNTDYGAVGDVVDADPRLISNLVVDQTLDNPAVIIAALEHAGYEGDFDAAVADLQGQYATYKIIASALGDVEDDNPALAAIREDLYGHTSQYGIEMDGTTVFLPNVSPDIGDSASYSSIFTLFGQFFDHGLDHVAKGNNGTVYMPLSPDDPLYVPGAHTNFMAVSRASTGDNAMNTTTPWVDQNQTYGSHASVQVFLREYILVDGRPVATGNLLEGARGGMATWGDVKAQAANILGIKLTDLDVGSVPLLATDEYGNFIPGANGFPQLVVGLLPNDLVEGTLDGGGTDPSLVGAFRTPQAFLLDIAHHAAPGSFDPDHNPATQNSIPLVADSDTEKGDDYDPLTYDDETLDAHFIAGDGRANENIGLTAIHHVFHAEHNRVVEHAKEVIIATGDMAFLNEWLLVDVTAIPPQDDNYSTWLDGLLWDGERLFQAGRFTTEMEYQHLVFEEFARKMQPDVDAFLFEPDPDINPAIFAEFANVVYRFGHSMLRETIDRTFTDGTTDDLDLFDAFLNPIVYDNDGSLTHDVAAGAILRGLSGQVGNEIDEFVTDVLRNQLVGIPLDLPAINIARGRDTNMPTLNEARAQFRAAAGGDSQLDPYISWVDFALNLKNPASIVNFIAAYGTHQLIADEFSIAGKRAAAMALVFGSDQTFVDGITNETRTITGASAADRLDFLNSTGAWATQASGLDSVDLWIGGLAEKKMDFGGMLGSTFSAVFELQLENLQDGDRFYYLSRVQGMNLLSELEGNSLAKMVLRNTELGEDGTAIPGDIFSRPDLTLYIDEARQLAMTGLPDPQHDNATLEAISQMVDRRDTDGDGVTDYMRYNGGDHVVMQGSDGNDTLIGGEGDDSLWGGDGDDRLDGGYGVDHVHGGAGDDIIRNSGTDIGAADFLHGEEGNDVIHGGSGLTLMFGNQGQDFMVAGPDGKTVMGGTDNDFILGGDGMDFLLGEAGDDWLEGGGRFDTLAGENSELFFNSSIIGHDVLNGQKGDVDYDAESGDDIMFQGVGIQRSNGMAGFDWAIHKGDEVAANSDLGIPIFATQEDFILRDRFDLVEGLSGWKFDDVLTGREANVNTRAELTGTAAIPGPDSILDSYSSALLEKNVSLISGLDTIVAHSARTTETGNDGTVEVIAFQSNDASDILLGGGGHDRIKGLAGNDVIDGDKWLNARIRIVKDGITYTADGMTRQVFLEAALLNGVLADGAEAQFDGRNLDDLMFDRTFNPGQLSIVREIVDGNQAGDIDTAVYTDLRVNYGFGVNTDGSLYVNHAPPATDDTDVAGDNIEGVTEKPLLDGRDTVRNVERLEFTDLTMNVINGSDANETLNGNVAGTGLIHDVIMGFGGNDVLNGGSGDDVLIGGSGNDRLNGGSGDDNYIFGLTDGQDIIDETSGTDTISIAVAGAQLSELNFRRAANGDLQIDLNGQRILVTDHFENADKMVETISFDSGSYGGYDFYLADDEGDEVFRGSYVLSTNVDLIADADVDTILADVAGGTASTLLGNSGDDMLFGNGGADFLNGRAGIDLLVGGTGNDTYIVDDLGDTVVELAGAGNDIVQTSLPSYMLDANVERMTYTGTGEFTGAGNELNNVIVGGSGGDSLYGALGDDRLVGGEGDDYLDGGAGDDILNGAEGNDAIHGGAGNDTINVGAGANTIVYTEADFGTDTVASFDANANGGQDKIDLSGLGITDSNFATQVSITTVGNDTHVSVGSGTIILTGVAGTGANAIDRTDFILANDVDVLIDGDDGDNVLDGTGRSDVMNGFEGNDVINGHAGDDIIDGGMGDDVVNGGSGDDTIHWTAPETGSGGWDVIDGGSEGIAGDTFVIEGNTQFEIFRFYPAEDAEAVIPGLVLKGAATEIVVTRTVVTNGVEGEPQVIAELSEIEEIVVNGNPASGVGTSNGDRFELIGDFAEQGEETSLRTSTITIIGSNGDDVVDISSLMSAHRIVFKSKGGNDTIIGTLRPQDVVDLEDGKTIADYVKTTNLDGSTTLSSDTHTVTFFSTGSGPQFGDGANEDDPQVPPSGDGDGYVPAVDDDDDDGDDSGNHDNQDDEDEDDDDDDNDHEDDDSDDTSSGDDDDADDGNAVPVSAHADVGTEDADVLIGTEDGDVLMGLGGNDVIFAHAGDDDVLGGGGADMLYGDGGNDRILGGDGNDLINGGSGNDTVFGGDGNDIIVAQTGDGTDIYYGDGMTGGLGNDTLDMSAITANITADLGTGFMNRGIVSSAETGNDTIWGIENFIGGSGTNTVTASAAVNAIDTSGGMGGDVFRFLSADHADGDTIIGFQTGDRIDLSFMDANGCVSGKQDFTLVSDAFSGKGQLLITHENRDGEDFTVVQGNTTGGDDADFKLSIKGSHDLSASDFNL